jgi:malate dehydrogenase
MANRGKVTVVGAGFYGSTTAQRLAEYDIFETVVLTDILEGKPEGLALDINQSRPIEGFETKVVGVGGGSYDGTENSDVVVITAGLPRKPGMSRMDLLETNAKIVRAVAENVARTSPDAVIVVVSNPLDEMTALAQLASGFPRERVLGQAGMLDTARGCGRRRTSRVRGLPDPRLARRHDGAGALALHSGRQATDRRPRRRHD